MNKVLNKLIIKKEKRKKRKYKYSRLLFNMLKTHFNYITRNLISNLSEFIKSLLIFSLL